MKHIATVLYTVLLCFTSQLGLANTQRFFNVSATGTPANLSIALCLNARGPLTCQNYMVSAINLNITTVPPNHTYPLAGIKIFTPGYSPSGCTPISNGYCLFSVSNTVPATIATLDNIPHSVGGTVSGYTTSGLILQNNGTDSLPLSASGGFTFPTQLANGASYSVTILSQPAGQTCSIANGSGIISSANVTNVTVTCSTITLTLTPTSGANGTITIA